MRKLIYMSIFAQKNNAGLSRFTQARFKSGCPQKR